MLDALLKFLPDVFSREFVKAPMETRLIVRHHQKRSITPDVMKTGKKNIGVANVKTGDAVGTTRAQIATSGLPTSRRILLPAKLSGQTMKGSQNQWGFQVIPLIPQNYDQQLNLQLLIRRIFTGSRPKRDKTGFTKLQKAKGKVLPRGILGGHYGISSAT